MSGMWVQNSIVIFVLAIQLVSCCYIRHNITVDDPKDLVPKDHPTKMLGWEQMLFMFEDPKNASGHGGIIKGYGITERGSMCHFKFKMDAKFNPGAATIPTHGGFLMCGQNAEDRNDVIPVDKNHFFCCYWSNKRYAIMNHTCEYIESFFEKDINKPLWTTRGRGKLILSTDYVLEQYQNTMYAFFQGTGEVYVGGIIWSPMYKNGTWIINWVQINTKSQIIENLNWPSTDPCLVVIGTDLFIIGGRNNNGKKLKKTYGYRLNKTGFWFEANQHLTTPRDMAACFVDKKTKDVFTVGGNIGGENKGKRPTIEIARYQAHKPDVQGRFIGYDFEDKECKNLLKPGNRTFPPMPVYGLHNNSKECNHTELDEGFAFYKTLYAFQLDNDDGNRYKTVILGRKNNDESFNQPTVIGSKYKEAEHKYMLKYLKIVRLHGDSEQPFPLTFDESWRDEYWEGLKHIGEDTFHVVPIRTIGFRPCVPHVPFKKHGKIVVTDPHAPDYYVGYWWDPNLNNGQGGRTELKKQGGKPFEEDEYYYYLNPHYEDYINKTRSKCNDTVEICEKMHNAAKTDY